MNKFKFLSRASLLLAIFFINSYANENISVMPSLDWQKQNLELRILDKVDRIVGSVLSKEQYNIDVEIITKAANTPQFYDSQKQNSPLGELKKVDGVTQSNNVNTKNSEAQPDSNSKAQIKFDDVNLQEEKEDVVTFTKFGIQAPLIDDFNDFRPDGKIILTMQGGSDQGAEKLKEEYEAREKSLKEKLEQLKSESAISPVEQIWKYNDSIDVFKNLKEINITVRLSSAISADVVDAVKKYVKQIKFNLGKVEPVIKFENTLLMADTKAPSRGTQIREILDYLGKFSTLIGIVFGIVLLGLVGKTLMNKFFEMNAMQSHSQKIKLEGDNVQNDKDEKDGGFGASVATGEAGQESLSSEFSGVERFRSFSKTSIQDAILLIKGWLGDSSKDSDLALRALVQQMDNSDLVGIFSALSARERNEWKDKLEKPLTKNELISANKFISSQVVQSIIIPGLITDIETFDLLVRIRPDQVIELTKEKPEISSVLLNVLNSSFLSKVLSHCEADKREEILDNALKIREEDIINSQGNLKVALKEFVTKFEKVPFVDKIVNILPGADKEVELISYKKLLQTTSSRRIKELALVCYPSFLIENFPDNVLKEILSSYTLSEKVKLMLTIDVNLKKKFMGIYAPEGSKAYDLLHLEFENYEKNEKELEKIKCETTKIWQDFANYVRFKISKDKELLNVSEEIVELWTKQNSESSSGPDLRVVA